MSVSTSTWLPPSGGLRENPAKAGSHSFTRRSDARTTVWLCQRLAIQREQTTPRFLRRRLVVDARIGRTPSVRARIDLDFRRQTGFGEGVLQHVFLSRGSLIVVGGDADQELRLR